MNIADKIKLKYPLSIAKSYEIAGLQSNPVLHVQRLIDLFEETVRYLALLGLASYIHYDLKDALVEKQRQGLNKPSFGHWLNLLQSLVKTLNEVDPGFLTTPFNHGHKNDAIAEATALLCSFTGVPVPKNIKLTHFLDAVVEFRNKKIGHGTLSKGEAKKIEAPLEAALTAWLDHITCLHERHLIYVSRVEYDAPRYILHCTNLNAGSSLSPLQLDGNAQIKGQQVYWHHNETDVFIPLHPLFNYDDDLYRLFIYQELNSKRKPLLRCTHATGQPDHIILEAVDGAAVVGMAPLMPDAAPTPQTAPTRTTQKKDTTTMMRNWFDVIQPHEDIRKGQFDEAVFAADLGDVFSGKAPADYNDPYLFFRKTYLTAGLQGLLGRVYTKLSAGVGASVVQVKTPFGGGKTHSLVTLYHYLKHGNKIKELLPPGLGLIQPKVVVIAGTHWNPVEGRTTDGLTRFTFWGELAYQLGGRDGYEQFRLNDEARISPGKEKIRDFLAEYQPFILLFDEILEYVNRAIDQRDEVNVSLGTQTFSFFQELTDSVASLSHGMLVVTLPSSKLEDFGDREEESLARLSKIFGRSESIETPVKGQEVYAVIRRRLFEEETLQQTAMREIAHAYFQKYQAHKDDLPSKARDLSYRDKLEMAYPFHPDVIDILYEKWSTFSSFQRTRGVLRLLANVVERLYQQERNIDLILPGDVDLDHPGVRQEFLKHIGPEYEGVISSDIAGHESKSQALDAANKSWKHLSQRIATAVFFHSFSADDSEKGINLPYIKLAVMRSDTYPAMVTEILQKEANLLWYLNSRGDNYYFSKIPNLNRMILDKKELYNEAFEEELKTIVEKEAGPHFRTYIWPTSGDGIPDNRELKLLILHPHDQGKYINEWIERKGQSFREYKNTLFFVLADSAAYGRMREDVKTYLALAEIKREVDSDLKSPLAVKRQEIQDRMLNIRRDYSYNLRRMYHNLRVGKRTYDLGQPVAGNETLGHWYWRELTSKDIGAIVETLHYRTLVNKLMAGNEKVATSVILDQFYKNLELPAPASEEVLTRAIQLGVQESAFGLVIGEGEVTRSMLRYQEHLPLGVISFEPGFFLLANTTCESLLAKWQAEEDARRRQEEEKIPDDGEKPEKEEDGQQDEGKKKEEPGKEIVVEKTVYHHVRLVIKDVLANRIADVNRGIFMPLSAASDDPLTFTMTIEVRSEDGITLETLENKVKETIRQIGARIVEEEKD